MHLIGTAKPSHMAPPLTLESLRLEAFSVVEGLMTESLPTRYTNCESRRLSDWQRRGTGRDPEAAVERTAPEEQRLWRQRVLVVFTIFVASQAQDLT